MDFSSFSEAEIISLSDLNRTLFIRIKTDFGKVIRKIDKKEKLGKKNWWEKMEELKDNDFVCEYLEENFHHP